MEVDNLLRIASDSSGLAGLQSKKSIQRLEQISSLRACGMSNRIDLPQLAVCGDQSCGKSSTLEGLTNIPFPRADGVCTKFPTEVILEHSDEQESITAAIIPHPLRSDQARARLQEFHANIEDYSQLPQVISSAGALMGLRGYGDNLTGPAFVEDVLRIKVVGRTGLHLSIVDLPGLISTASEEQTEEDIQTVQRMVDSYIQKPRTIILAIVQASNDIANQRIIRKSKQYDRAGQRTVGVITKPDLINRGTESRVALLAKNQDTTKLQLGFYMLKNPTPTEMEQAIVASQRSANEYQLFHSSPWREQNLDAGRVGIDKLRGALQALLDQHVEKELPNVREEIRAMIRSTEQDLLGLPKERPTLAHLRMFLSELAMQYHSLTSAALSGDYHTTHVDFFATDGNDIGVTRLRALVHYLNTEFADEIREKGQSFKQTNSMRAPKLETTSPVDKKNGYWAKKKKKNTPMAWPVDDTPPVQDACNSTTRLDDLVPSIQAQEIGEVLHGRDSRANGQVYITEAELKAWVRETYLKTRGRELPGSYNHVLLTELFHHQSRRWPQIAGNHVDAVYDSIVTFVEHAVAHLKVEDHVHSEIYDGMNTKLQDNKAAAERELHQLCVDEQQHPITYNHYYTDNVQKSRIDQTHRMLELALSEVDFDDGSGFANNLINPATVLATLQKHVTVNMDEQACSEALDGLNAYYKVALKTFVDNVCRQVIERHLLANLSDLLSPREVAGYADDELTRIAGERPDVAMKRRQWQEQLEIFQAGLKDLRK
ncbi:hypothetical protein LTR02_017711 [Friedmanniomyces endolithicus]|nr:hypothetical protein LTR02_017711 [Friedmanniomyces endolithicus]